MTDLIITDLRSPPASALGEVLKNLPYPQILSVASQALTVYAQVKEQETRVRMTQQYVKAHEPVVKALGQCLVDQNRCRLRLISRSQDDQACSVALLVNRTLNHLTEMWASIRREPAQPESGDQS